MTTLHRSMKRFSRHPNRQSCAVLVITLILLIMLMIIGISGSRETGLEEKMAGNMRDSNLAFQAAESALIAGEVRADQLTKTDKIDPCANPAIAGYYNPTNPNCKINGMTNPIWENVDWTNNAQTIQYADTLSSVSIAPRFIIEYLGPVECTGAPPQCKTSYRITARATGITTNSPTILQVVYINDKTQIP